MACVRSILGFRTYRGVALLFILLSLAPPSALSAGRDPYKVFLLLSGEDRAYDLAASTLTKTLFSSAGRAIPFDIKKLVIRSGNGTELAAHDLFKEEDYDLIIPVGTDASRAVSSGGQKTPVLNILTTKEAFDAIWRRERPDDGRQVSAIYLEQPISRQIQFIRLALPRHRNCGVLLGKRSLHLVKELDGAADKNRLHLQAVDISANKKPIDGIRNIITDNDVILAVPDAETLTPNIAKWLLYMAYQREVPVIGFSKAIVDAGALGAIYTTPEQIGRQAAEIVLRSALDAMHSKSTSWRLPPPQYPEYFEISINDSVARSLKLHVHSGRSLAESLITLERSESWRAQN